MRVTQPFDVTQGPAPVEWQMDVFRLPQRFIGRQVTYCSAKSNLGVVKVKDLIECIAKALVDEPEAVRVNEIQGAQTSVIELAVAKDDIGKIIGKQGRTARAIRTILSAASTKIKKRSVLEILE